MITQEKFVHYQPLGGSDPAYTATAPSGIATPTPALTPLMLEGDKLVIWKGDTSGTAVGVLAQALTGSEASLTYYKSGTFRLDAINWPEAASEPRRLTAFVGSCVSVI